jgi:hypothetical protein
MRIWITIFLSPSNYIIIIGVESGYVIISLQDE